MTRSSSSDNRTLKTHFHLTGGDQLVDCVRKAANLLQQISILSFRGCFSSLTKKYSQSIKLSFFQVLKLSQVNYQGFFSPSCHSGGLIKTQKQHMVKCLLSNSNLLTLKENGFWIQNYTKETLLLVCFQFIMCQKLRWAQAPPPKQNKTPQK